ncbi:hypothetical protein [Acinetobacter sp. P8-3-8]|uniref:hypothetical protein n=1 Tax=Acinetobacter sp. P8-3-8 TaxID=1029823 RepID=UPI001D0D22EC|nr:hypothetical protein [Acinetobacter sp. P8-3-8]
MSIHLDSEDNRRNKFVDQTLKDLLEINKLQGISIKKMKADQNGIFYVEQEISIEDLLKKWTAPSILDMRQPHFEAASKASGLIPSRCE